MGKPLGRNMNEQTIDKHSVNCYFCNRIVDERNCIPADEWNGNDGGECCTCCQASFAEGERVAKEVVKLKESLGGFWGEHPDYFVRDWSFEVGHEDTRLGYWEWVVSKIEEAKEDEDNDN